MKKTLLKELIAVAQDLNTDITMDTGKNEKERQKDMETAISRIIEITEALLTKE